jgi:hypothetical protein
MRSTVLATVARPPSEAARFRKPLIRGSAIFAGRAPIWQTSRNHAKKSAGAPNTSQTTTGGNNGGPNRRRKNPQASLEAFGRNVVRHDFDV